MKKIFLKIILLNVIGLALFSCQEVAEETEFPAGAPLSFSLSGVNIKSNHSINLYSDANENNKQDANEEKIKGNVIYYDNIESITFYPYTSLKEGEIINIEVKDSNNEICFSKTIRISAKDETAPSLNESLLEDKLEVNNPIKLSFDDYINPETINTDNIKVIKTDGNDVPLRLLYSGKDIHIIFQERTKPEEIFTLYLTGIKNVSGLSLQSKYIVLENKNIDYGLYFYSYNGLVEKYTPGFKNEFYNPQNPVLLYAHGWQPNKVNKQGGYLSESFILADEIFKGNKDLNGTVKFLNHSWLDKGWNTAIVHWDQFADEPTIFNQDGKAIKSGVIEAESKIWSFDGPCGNRYRVKGENLFYEFDNKITFNGSEITVKNAGELLGLYVVNALKKNTSGNIRLAGHSLGNQMACNLAKILFDNEIYINRIALLDPAWTGGVKDYFANTNYENYGSWTGEVSRNILFEIRDNTPIKNFVIEIYHTTVLNQSLGLFINLDNPLEIDNSTFEGIDNNIPLTKQAVDVHLKPWYFGATQIAEKHRAARYHYFLSMDSENNSHGPIEYKWSMKSFFQWDYIKTGRFAPSAAVSDSLMHSMMQENSYWEQIFNPLRNDLSNSNKTLTVQDDNFEKKRRFF